MQQFFFTLRDGSEESQDPDGVWLADGKAAVEYGKVVAQELMQHRENEARYWQIDIIEGAGAVVGEIPFATVDPTLDGLAQNDRRRAEKWANERLRFKELVASVQKNRRDARALVARSRGKKPYLAAIAGKKVG